MAIKELNSHLYKAYLLKEDIRTYWSLSYGIAETFHKNLIRQAQAIGNRCFTTLDEKRDGLF